MKRVAVLGHRGMLGHVVARYLQEIGHEVITTEARWRPATAGAEFAGWVRDQKLDWCVNCVGRLPRGESDASALTFTNAQFPAMVSRELPAGCGLVHASSDAVFAASRETCEWDWDLNPDTEYGRTKAEAEAALVRPNDIIIRCSIVGPELGGGARSLLGWLQRQSGSINGFTNQKWNGVTTLEWARWCGRVLAGEALEAGRVIQPASTPVVSKYELLQRLAEFWGAGVDILPAESQPVARFLKANVPERALSELLAEFVNWY